MTLSLTLAALLWQIDEERQEPEGVPEPEG
jgi:hypothetical protein